MESTQSHETQTDPVAKVDDVISESEIEQIRTATLKSDVDGLHSLLTNLQQNGHSVQTFQLLYGEVNGQQKFHPLHIACLRGDIDMITLLLDTFQVNPDTRSDSPSGFCPLHVAAKYGRIDVVKLLIDTYKADPEKSTHDGVTILHIAAVAGQETVVKYLLRHHRVNANTSDKDSRTSPLHGAASRGFDTIVHLLIDEGKADPNQLDKSYRTPAEYAATEDIANYLRQMRVLEHWSALDCFRVLRKNRANGACFQRLVTLTKMNPDVILFVLDLDEKQFEELLESTQNVGMFDSVSNLLRQQYDVTGEFIKSICSQKGGQLASATLEIADEVRQMSNTRHASSKQHEYSLDSLSSLHNIISQSSRDIKELHEHYQKKLELKDSEVNALKPLEEQSKHLSEENQRLSETLKVQKSELKWLYNELKEVHERVIEVLSQKTDPEKIQAGAVDVRQFISDIDTLCEETRHKSSHSKENEELRALLIRTQQQLRSSCRSDVIFEGNAFDETENVTVTQLFDHLQMDIGKLCDMNRQLSKKHEKALNHLSSTEREKQTSLDKLQAQIDNIDQALKPTSIKLGIAEDLNGQQTARERLHRFLEVVEKLFEEKNHLEEDNAKIQRRSIENIKSLEADRDKISSQLEEKQDRLRSLQHQLDDMEQEKSEYGLDELKKLTDHQSYLNSSPLHLYKLGNKIKTKKHRVIYLHSGFDYRDPETDEVKGFIPLKSITGLTKTEGSGWFQIQTLPHQHGGEYQFYSEEPRTYQLLRGAIKNLTDASIEES